jgi:hypothetical protein
MNARADEARRVSEELARKYPDDAFTPFILANNHDYFDWRRGRFWKDSLEIQIGYLERAYELDPLEGDLAGWLRFTYAEPAGYRCLRPRGQTAGGEFGVNVLSATAA